MMTLSNGDARSLVLAAQGFGGTGAGSGEPELAAAMQRIQLLQLDAVNVVTRSHYLPLFSRLGPYAPSDLDRLVDPEHRLFEYWGHMASLLVVDTYPLLRWRMDVGDEGNNWRQFDAWGRAQAKLVDALYDRIRADGPLAVSDLRSSRGSVARGKGWSGGSDAKTALEYLFWKGRVSATRRANFERVYDLTERLLPRHVLEADPPKRDDAERQLVLRSACALGIATIDDLADYFALHKARVKRRVAELVSDGDLVSVEVEGWDPPVYAEPGAIDTGAAATIRHRGALVSPFDSLVFNRPRTERVFDFRYRLEMYVPAARRTYGYYVLPFLLGDRLVGRVDLKADRAARTLVAKGVWLEPGTDRGEVHDALDVELERMAGWLGLDDFCVTGTPSTDAETRTNASSAAPRLF